MKKYFILAAIAITALASCTKDEPVNSAESQKIAFEAPVIGTATKVDLPKTFPNTQNFGVFALHYTTEFNGFSSGVKYMDNVTVSPTDIQVNNNSYKTWTSDYYWPKTGSLTFAAYAPVSNDVTATHTTQGIQFTDYEVKDDADIDLLFSERSYNKTSTSQDATETPKYYGVDITFKHALSAVLFQFKAQNDLVDESGPKYEFIVTEVKVNNVYNKGSFNQDLTEYSEQNKQPQTDDNTKGWSISDNAIEKEYTAYTSSSTGITVNSTTATSAFGTTTTDKADLILLPQNLDRSNVTNGKKVTVTVKYKLRHSGMDTGVYIDNNVVTADLATTETAEWIRGKRYVYTLIIALDKIYLEPTMTDWASGTTTPIEKDII